MNGLEICLCQLKVVQTDYYLEGIDAVAFPEADSSPS